jgi:hypothetical protein
MKTSCDICGATVRPMRTDRNGMPVEDWIALCSTCATMAFCISGNATGDVTIGECLLDKSQFKCRDTHMDENSVTERPHAYQSDRCLPR